MGSFTLGPQFAYEVEPVHAGQSTGPHGSGLVELIVLPDSTLLALERSWATGSIYQCESRIYQISFAGATDISLPPFDAGLSGEGFVPVTKKLLWRGQAGSAAGQNLEGLALGPQLVSGDWLLVGVVDNNGLGDSSTVAFSLTPPRQGDFNADGSVDAADYIVWRKGFEVTYTQNDYDTSRTLWRDGQRQHGGTLHHALPSRGARTAYNVAVVNGDRHDTLSPARVALVNQSTIATYLREFASSTIISSLGLVHAGFGGATSDDSDSPPGGLFLRTFRT